MVSQTPNATRVDDWVGVFLLSLAWGTVVPDGIWHISRNSLLFVFSFGLLGLCFGRKFDEYGIRVYQDRSGIKFEICWVNYSEQPHLLYPSYSCSVYFILFSYYFFTSGYYSILP